jgi:hypothetical protein
MMTQMGCDDDEGGHGDWAKRPMPRDESTKGIMIGCFSAGNYQTPRTKEDRTEAIMIRWVSV